MRFVYGAIGVALPFVGTLLFMFYAGKKYNSIDENYRYSAHILEFPERISDYSTFLQSLYLRKLSIYYTLLVVNFLLCFFLPRIGSISTYISSLLFIWFGVCTHTAVTRCKRVLRGMSSHDRLLCTPILSLYRSSFIYCIFLLFCFNLFFECFYC